MVQVRIAAKKAILVALSALLLLPSTVDAQFRRLPPVRPSTTITRPLPPRPIPPRPPVRPPLPGGGARVGPAIRPPSIRPGGIRPAGPGISGRPSSIAIRPTTLPRSGPGMSRPSGGGIAIKQGANVSLKPLAPIATLTARLKGSSARTGSLAAARPALRADPRIIQAKRLAAASRPTASSIQRVRAELRKPGKVLTPVQCAAVNSCPPQRGKYYQKVKEGIVENIQADFGQREKTPAAHKSLYEPIRGRPGKRNIQTGEVWVKDQLHKDHYEIYKDTKDYEKGLRSRAVWIDGRKKDL